MDLPTRNLNQESQLQRDRRLFAKKRDAIYQMWESGEPVRRIATLYNVSTQRIYRIIVTERKKRGIPHPMKA